MEHAHVDLPLLLSEGAAVTLGSVQPVVEPLRHPEEVLVTFDHDPSAPDPSFGQIAEELMEELCYPSTLGRGVHVPEGSAVEPGGHCSQDRSELLEMGRPDQPFESGE
jgi:hypothetical protein